MLKMVDTNAFDGKWKEAAALSHAQVSKKPLSFFVLNDKVKRPFQNNRVIINARIAVGNNPIKFKEACMSYPDHNEIKTDRYEQITAVFQVPTWWGGLKTLQLGLTGIPAYIVQHEVDHALGIGIYDLDK